MYTKVKHSCILKGTLMYTKENMYNKENPLVY